MFVSCLKTHECKEQSIEVRFFLFILALETIRSRWAGQTQYRRLPINLSFSIRSQIQTLKFSVLHGMMVFSMSAQVHYTTTYMASVQLRTMLAQLKKSDIPERRNTRVCYMVLVPGQGILMVLCPLLHCHLAASLPRTGPWAPNR